MGRGEVKPLIVKIKNNSNSPYGFFKGSCGTVVLSVHFDARILPVGPTNDANYKILYDRKVCDSMYIKVVRIPPKKSVVVKIMVQMERRAEFGEICLWQADLHYKSKLVEYKHKSIEISPIYLPQNPSADVLFIVKKNFEKSEFEFWEHIFTTLEVSVDYWDIIHEKGLSVRVNTGARHKNSWFGNYAGKMILYPHCPLQLLLGVDIAMHFHGSKFRKTPLQENGSSMVLFMPKSKTDTSSYSAVLKHLSLVNSSLSVPSSNYSGTYLYKPNPNWIPPPYLKAEEKLVKTLEESVPSVAPVLLTRKLDIRRISFFTFSYGSIDFRRIPLLRSSNFIHVADKSKDIICEAISALPRDPTNVSLPTAYGQVFLATLCGLPLPSKLKLIKSPPADLFRKRMSFHLPNKLILSREELVMITIAREVADELVNFSGEATRMDQIYRDVKDNADSYMENSHVVWSGLQLIKAEVKNQKMFNPNEKIAESSKAILQRVQNVQDILTEKGAGTIAIQALPGLRSLQDPQQIHRCHQDFTSEGKWSIV